jgi:DNA polymerase delta subunit 1
VKMTDQVADQINFRLLYIDLVDEPPPSQQRDPYLDYATVRMVGRDQENRTICVYASSFAPYFFLKLPPDWLEYQIHDLKDFVCGRYKTLKTDIIDITIQESMQTYCFSDDKLFKFAKFSFRGRKSMNRCKRLFPRNTAIQVSEDVEAQVFEVCEAEKIPEILKYLHDTQLQPAGWVTIDRAKCTSVQGETTCQFNYHCDVSDVKPLDDDSIPSFVEASFDGEMSSHLWEFPRFNRTFDMVVELAIVFKRNGKVYRKVLLCLDEMGNLSQEGIEVFIFAQEEELLMAFLRLIQEEDPDILTGFNTVDFDWPFLLNRAKFLNLPETFNIFGRCLKEPTHLQKRPPKRGKDGKYVKAEKDDKQKDKYYVPIIPGRRIEDCYMITKKFLRAKMNSYKLDDVAMEIVGHGKHDVKPEDIFRSYTDSMNQRMALQFIPLLGKYLREEGKGF